MLKVLKYDLMGKYKFIAGGCGLLVVVNLLLLLGMNVIWTNAPKAVAMFFSFMMLFAVIIISIVNAANSLYQKEGYLLLLLPQKGWAILAAKILGAFIEIGIFSIVGFLMLVLQGFGHLNFAGFLSKLSHEDFIRVLKALVYSGIDSILGFTLLLLTIYFARSAARSILSRKRSRGLVSFLVFAATWTIHGIVQYAIIKMIPMNELSQTFKIGNISIGNNSTVTAATFIYELLFIVGLFTAAAYLIENKVEV